MVSADTHVKHHVIPLQKMKNLFLIMLEENNDNLLSHQQTILKNAAWHHKNLLLEPE